MNSEGGYHQNAGAVACGGPQKAASAQFTVGAVGFGPTWDDDDDQVQLTHAGWKLVTDGMAESIVRISRELEEAQAQIAVYEAERTILLGQIRDLENLVELYKGEVSRLVRRIGYAVEASK